MAVPKETLWEAPPHTLAKHDILRRYLQAWLPILLRRSKKVVYVDGFSGPGEYSGGEPGSPIVALDAARDHLAQGTVRRDRRIVFVFIEQQGDRAGHLRSLLHPYQEVEQFEIFVQHHTFDGSFSTALDRLRKMGGQIAPTFVFADPFGFGGLPMSLLHRVLHHERTEIFANLAIDSVNRFFEHPGAHTQAQISDLMGVDVTEVDLSKEKRLEVIRSLYQSGLEEKAGFVRSFRMLDWADRPVYDLFFASNHPLGHAKMKEAMWSVDPQGNFRFSDATDPQQTVLFDADPEAQLLERILSKYKDKARVRVAEIEEWVKGYTAFLRKHMRGALELGENKGAFFVEPLKLNGKKRHGTSFPPNVVINFTRRGNPPVEQGSLFS